MNKKTKVIISALAVCLSISSANAGILDFVKKNPVMTAVGVGGALYLQSTMHISRDLSFHLEKVNPFFNEHPEKYNPVAQYVLRALEHPANKQDYDRYKELAKFMKLDNIPPYAPTANNQPIILNNPIQEPNPSDNILENPIQQIDDFNVILDPQGKIIDTSTEFPYENPQSWDEYLLLKQDSTDLGDNIVNEEKRKNPNYIKPSNVAAHHLVSATSPETKDARDILDKYLKSITPTGEKTYNNNINGVLLPNLNNTDQSVPGITHNGRHPRDYNVKVNDLIVKADKRGGWTEVQKALNNIKQEILNAF